jgi:hypothetical protein
MKGVYNKEAVRAIVEPLKAITEVFDNNVAHVVYECEDDSMHISIQNPNGSVRAMWEMKTDGIVNSYANPVKEIGIYETKQFMNIFAKYLMPIYEDEIEVEVSDKRLEISCGKEKSGYATSPLHLFSETRGKVRRLKVETLTEATKFTLTGSQYEKLKTNMNVFDVQDTVTFSGKKGGILKVVLKTADGSSPNVSELEIDGVEVTEDFELNYKKSDIKGLISCHNEFEIGIYTGAKQIIGATYEKNNYAMRFYISPLDLSVISR